ncbi:MAG: TIGR04013 family B12-binding domain/radical SAM domain-containing protein [candidate division WOR-3 bacterium]
MYETNIIIYYSKDNRYSFNPLIPLLEKDFNIFFAKKEEDLLKLLKELTGDKFLLVSFFTTQIFEIKNLVKKIRNLNIKNLTLIAGGPHPTGMPKEVLNFGFDYVVCGEGEYVILDLIKNKPKEKIIYGEKVLNLDIFLPFSERYKKFGPIEISRGCPFGCYFCQTPFLFGKNMRHRSIDSILKLVEILIRNNKRDIRFITPNSFAYGSIDGKSINYSALEELLKNIRNFIKDKGRIFLGSFPSEVRPEFVNEETISLIKKYCDNDNLVIGAQSGSERILKIINRGHKIEDIYKATEITIKNNLKANLDFIFGFPNEKEEDIKETIKVIKDLIKIGARIHLHTFIPLPQTPLFKIGLKDFSYNEEIIKLIKELLPKGKIYGNWEKQLIIRKKLIEFYKN